MQKKTALDAGRSLVMNLRLFWFALRVQIESTGRKFLSLPCVIGHFCENIMQSESLLFHSAIYCFPLVSF